MIEAGSPRQFDARIVAYIVLVKEVTDIFPKQRLDPRLSHNEHVVNGKHCLDEGANPLAKVTLRGLNHKAIPFSAHSKSVQYRL